jgi:hypothetical protein
VAIVLINQPKGLLPMSQLSKALSGFSTTLATALGGPLAGAALSLLGKAVLGDESASEDTVLQALGTNSPDLLLKIRQAENDFKLALANLDFQTTKLDYDDRGSARLREVAIQQAGRTSWEMLGLSGFSLITLVVCLALLFCVDIPKTAENSILFLLGTVNSMVVTVVQYYFGSSRSSQQKSDQLAAGFFKS